jgi:hypothetical protein
MGKLISRVTPYQDSQLTNFETIRLILGFFQKHMEILLKEFAKLPPLILSILQIIWNICEDKFPIERIEGESTDEILKKKLVPFINLLFLLFFTSPQIIDVLLPQIQMTPSAFVYISKIIMVNN